MFRPPLIFRAVVHSSDPTNGVITARVPVLLGDRIIEVSKIGRKAKDGLWEVPAAGDQIWVLFEDDVMTSCVWVSPGNSRGVTDHGGLVGLADDDHTQYHNDTRGDIRYYTKAGADARYSQLGHTHLVDVQVFTSNGTWTKPAGADIVEVFLVGGGGGGGTGRMGASLTERGGGGGGGGGQRAVFKFTAAQCGATVAVTVGAGGAGAPNVTTSNTSGSAGTAGGNSSFGSLARAIGGGGGGLGSSATPGSGGYGGNGITTNTTLGFGQQGGGGGIAGSINGSGGGSDASTWGGSGGGGGGGGNSSNTYGTGGSGGYAPQSGTGAGAAGGGHAGNATTNAPYGGGGGGGGTAGASGGGNGGLYGGGGGGGGAALNGFPVGKAGDGANGIVVVFTYRWV